MKSHADAVDLGELVTRPPAAAVCYGRKRLEDGLTADVRWARFFSSSLEDQAGRSSAAAARREAGDSRGPEVAIPRPSFKRIPCPVPLSTPSAKAILAQLWIFGISPAVFAAMEYKMRADYIAMASRSLGKDC